MVAARLTPAPVFTGACRRCSLADLRKDGANLVVEIEGAERARAPMHMLEDVVSFGRSGASPALLAACA